ncbi:SAM-dependent DNA methyltransferase [Hoeflea alexandrii]|uniref:SAM-dependent DNA methyltransferase n=1 Tax=Hoeflea alexandrii TaxID=288436 RepID=UPI0035CED94C
MRSANVMNERHQAADSLDYFPTPPWATRALLREVLLPRQNVLFPLSEKTALDPCCGGGHMVAPLQEVFRLVEFSDVHDWGINPPIRDFTFESRNSLEADGRAVPDWLFVNPPFNIAQSFFDTALKIAREGVAFFVRVSWLSGQERYNLIYRDTPPSYVVHFAERVSLMGGVWDPELSSATDYVWLVWVDGVPPQPPIWLRPGMEKTYTRISDMVLATPGEAKRRLAERKAEEKRRQAEKAGG